MKEIFFAKELAFRVKSFNLLGLTGIAVCISIVLLSPFTGIGMKGTVLNILAGIFLVALLFYAARSRNYERCYLIAVIGIFLILFPAMFFYSGGYRSGMSSFFVLGIVFTVYMLNGEKMFILTFLQALIYITVHIIAYRSPETVTMLQTEYNVVADICISSLIVAGAIGITMHFQFSFYEDQQKLLEQSRSEAETASRAKSAFLANMSHEIRTPLNIMMGANELILRDTSSEHIQRLAKRIRHSGVILQEIVSNVLDVSKIESGKMEMVQEVYSFAELVESFENISRELRKNSAVRYHMEVDEDFPPYLIGDVISIKKIAGNFLSNAFKYTNRGHIVLEIFFRLREDPEEIILCIEVSDTGVGIPKDEIKNIFESFNRADLRTHRHIEGTGLGLAIVKELTEMMGGTVHVESEYGKGSCFRAELPQRIADAAVEEEKSGNDHLFYAPQAKILAVDDNEDNLAILHEMLLPTGVQLDCVISGAECLEITEKNTYDVILMDYMMPEMDGLEVLRRLLDRKDFKTPVIALTANAVSETEDMLMSGGFSAYLTKPFTLSDLYKKLSRQLPPDRIEKIGSVKKEFVDYRSRHKALGDKLVRHGLHLSVALEYFEGDLIQLCKIAKLLADHYEQERAEVDRIAKEKPQDLRFKVHSIRSRARNVGMFKLSSAAAEIETLCNEQKLDEALTLLPHMNYLWEQGYQGLRILIRNIEALQSGEKDAHDPETEQFDPRAIYPDLLAALKNMNRRPALSRLESLSNVEKDTLRAQKIEEATEAVRGFDFKKAQHMIKELYEGEGYDETQAEDPGR